MELHESIVNGKEEGCNGPDLQRQTLLVFAAIFAVFPSWKRKLVVCTGGGQFASAAALAVLGLGGACLLLEETPDDLQVAGRIGATDFNVTDLTEALRILKNELRKGASISVGLSGRPEEHLVEMLVRGVQPDLVCACSVESAEVRAFARLGAVIVSFPSKLPLAVRAARIRADVAVSGAERRERDRRMLADLPSDLCGPAEAFSLINAKWLAVAPRLFPRDRTRFYFEGE